VRSTISAAWTRQRGQRISAGTAAIGRLRPPAGAMVRMWNMRMSQPVPGHVMAGM
jgi:hypothetical protein